MSISAVIFDIGNVLISWQPEREYDRAFGEARRREIFAAIDLHGMNERIDLGEDFSAVVAQWAATHPDWAEEIRWFQANWLAMASPVIDRSVRLLRALRRKGVPCHALSNFGVQTFALGLANYPFLDEFDRRFLSGEMRLTKPDPAIYAAVEAALPDAPGNLFFTDDRADNIAAAAARGWQTHLFTGPEGLAARLVAEGLLTESEAA